ncbi:MAG: NfeD family protein [Candidatus Krumholzibacteria bacterium]|nr:NfeD family protein [Candidatus Krumholzibacteria bacterium]
MPTNYWWIWMIMAAVFVVGEILTAAFFLLWFGVGAAVAGLAALLGLGTVWQLTVFVVVSVVLVAWSRKFADRFSKKQPPGIGADRFKERQGIVIETIDNEKNTGRVRLDREEWRAESDHGGVISSGAMIRVTGVAGTHVLVTEVKKGD